MFLSIGIPESAQPEIVATTSLTEQKYVTHALQSGIDRVMAKPVSIK